MSSAITLTIKKIETAPLKITVAIPPENPQIKGYFIGHAIIRTKDGNKQLGDRIDAGDFSDNDEALLRELYVGFDGLANAAGACTGDAAFKEILTGEASAYLIPAALQGYYDQYGLARQGNFARRR